MDNPEDSTSTTGFTDLDHDFTQDIEHVTEATTSLAPITEADTDFYQRVLKSCTEGITTIDKQLDDINGQAQRLLESKRKLTTDRQRLATQRNAARISIRYLEDSEAKRQGSGS